MTAPVPGSEPAPPSKRGQVAVSMGKYAVLVPVIVFVARAVARKWPAYADLIDEVLRAVNL